MPGSGAYKLEEWTSGQKVTLRRKSKWWGDTLPSKDKNILFDALPEAAHLQIVNDPIAAVTELKSGKIDVMAQMPPKVFKELKEDKKFQDKYTLYNPDELAYACINMNLRNPILSDIKVRRALASLLDMQHIVKDVMFGMGTATLSMESPAKTREYNSAIKAVPYDPAQAKKLLADAGWKDLDGDGTRGKKTSKATKRSFPWNCF